MAHVYRYVSPDVDREKTCPNRLEEVTREMPPIARRLPLNADLPLSRFLAFLLALLLTAVSGAVGRAQTPCGVLLNEAEKRYEQGDFEQVPELLAACTKGKTSRGERADAYALTAKAYVMSNRIPQARLTIEALLRVEPEFEPDRRRDPSRFIRLVAEVKRKTATAKVTSVSKSAESLREAPATVVVVTAEEIERRGYHDLEQLLHDLPGFDISRGKGYIYSNVYQRGLRSDMNTRTLLLYDGVEGNELWSQTMGIGSVFHLSSVERVEVIYGPASTMYGANAFAGVVNVITKESDSLIQEGRNLGAKVIAGAGSFGTRYFDATVAGRSKNGILSWSLTGRIFQSDDFDLSRFDDWDYDPAFFETFNYQERLRITGSDGVQNWLTYLMTNQLENCSGTPDCYYTVNADSVELTAAGLQAAIELDQAAYSQELMGRPIAFSDPTDNRHIYAKLRLSNLHLAVAISNYEQGASSWFTDLVAPGGNNGSIWDVEGTWLYAKYSRSIGKNLSLNFFSRYKLHEMGDNAVLTSLDGYANGKLGLDDLVKNEEATWNTLYYHLSSSQLRTELNTTYSPSEKFKLVSGIEFRNGSIQRAAVISFQPNPSETGFVFGSFPGDNHLRTTDLGVFAQASYKPWKNLKVVLGGRVDRNKVRESLGYGTVFVPRLALIYTLRNFVFKSIYSEAFQPASNHQKYMLSPGKIDIPNPDLQPERIKNFELSASWQPGDNLVVEVSGYDSRVSDVVQLQTVPCAGCANPTTLMFRGTGALRVRGLQATGSWSYNYYTLTGNYTFTEPYNTEPRNFAGEPLLDAHGNPIDKLRVGDMADHQINLQFEARLSDKLNFNAQANYVGSKKTGRNTTVSTNPYDEIDSYFIANAALTYDNLRSGFSLQLVVNNLFDEEYYHPGVRQADGIDYAARIPQSGRSICARLLFSF